MAIEDFIWERFEMLLASLSTHLIKGQDAQGAAIYEQLMVEHRAVKKALMERIWQLEEVLGS